MRSRTDLEGPEREQKYSSTLSLTSALGGGGGWSTPLYSHATPIEWDPLPIKIFINFNTDSLKNFKNLHALYLYEVDSDLPYICDIPFLSFRNLIYSTVGC